MLVINKDNNEMYEVYDIVYHQSGAPHFLIYKDGQWLRMSAKHFRPWSLEEAMSKIQYLNRECRG